MPISDTQGISAQAPLFTVHTTMSLSLYQKLCWTVNGKRLVLSGILLGLLASVLVLAYMVPSQPFFWFLLAGSLLFPLLLFFSYQRSVRLHYESTKFSRGLCTEYAFLPGCFIMKSSISEARIDYDSLYRILETRTAFYLLLGRNQGIVVEKAACPDGLPAFLQSLGKCRPAMRRLDIAAFASLIFCLFLQLCYLCINAFKPVNAALRLWVSRDFAACIALLFIIAVILVFAAFFTGRLAQIRRPLLRTAARILSAAVCLVLVLLCLAAALLLLSNEDKEIPNPDGSVTLRHSVWLNKPAYTTYIPQGIFYLCPKESLRSPELSSSSAELPKRTIPAPAASSAAPVLSDLSEGYQAIYDLFLADTCPLYEERFHAKGNSYILVNDTDSFAEFLEYCRDSQNGLCGLYVYYRCPKSQDGSWSIQEQEILNIYAYEYATGAMAVSGKTSWSASASQAYLDLTGE